MSGKRLLPNLRAAVLAMGFLVTLSPQAWSQPGGSPFLQRLHNDLQLSTSQEGAWNTFQQSYQMDPQEMARQRDASDKLPGLTGPQRMDLAIGMAEDNLAGMRRRGDALKSFYGALSPVQQKIFDRDTLPPRGQ
jgi:protein CpxP